MRYTNKYLIYFFLLYFSHIFFLVHRVRESMRGGNKTNSNKTPRHQASLRGILLIRRLISLRTRGVATEPCEQPAITYHSQHSLALGLSRELQSQ